MHAAASRPLSSAIKEIIVPRYPGYFSDVGHAGDRARCDFAITALTRADDMYR